MAGIAFALLLLSAVVQIVFLFSRREKLDPFSHWPVAAASVLFLAELIHRSVLINFIAVTGIYESLLLFAFLLTGFLFLYRLQRRVPVYPLLYFGLTIAAAAMPAIASSPLAPSEVQPPVPALQSSWLVLHVVFAFLGEVFFTIAFVAALLFLLIKDGEKRKGLDRIIYTSVGIGYPIYTLGALIFGAIWAEKAWGSFWSWDPKETWALITWLFFTLYLHLRLWRGKRGVLPPIVVILGFLIALFTFLGVNYLFSSLHSYV